MSDLQARREARRRKILENAEERLKKITGVQQRSADHTRSADNTGSADHTLEGHKNTTQEETVNHESLNGAPHNLSFDLDQTSLISNAHINSIPELRTFFERSIDNPNNVPSQDTLNQGSPFANVDRNVLIAIIAFLTNILLELFKNQDPFLVNKIFVPLFAFEAIDFFYTIKNDTQNDPMTNLILLFFARNIPPRTMLTVSKYFRLFTVLFKDMMIYFFAFVCIGYVFQVIGSNFS